VRQEENHKKGPRRSWAKDQMGNPLQMRSFTAVAFFLSLSLIGLILSAIVDIATTLGRNPEETFPAIWLLHIGLFVVIIPAIIFSKKIFANSSELWNFCPIWMKGAFLILAIGAYVNGYFADNALREGGPGIIDGREVLENHGRFVRNLTHPEYELFKSYETRGFAGWWVIGYGAATLILFSDCEKSSF
jgi:hypothetical protein